MNNKLNVSPSVSNRALHKRRFFWTWHRRLGLFALVLVAILSVTGILLNHTDALRLDEKPVRNALLLKLYGIKTPTIQTVAIARRWLSQIGATLYLDEKPLLACDGQLVGAAENNDIIVAACSNELILLTHNFQLVERIGQNYELPRPVAKFGLCEKTFCLTSGNHLFALDFDQLQWTPFNNTTAQAVSSGKISAKKITTQIPSADLLPQPLKEKLINQYLGSEISWERVVLDLHSGRIFGAVGVALMDLAAVVLMVLGLSGFWLWWSGPGNKRKCKTQTTKRH